MNVLYFCSNAYVNAASVSIVPDSGVVCPELMRIADAYEIPFVRVSNNEDFQPIINDVLNSKGAMICYASRAAPFSQECILMDKEACKITSASLEKMAPFMSEELQNESVFSKIV